MDATKTEEILSVFVPGTVTAQWEFKHWREYQKYRDSWYWSIAAILGRATRPYTKQVSLLITVYRARLLDLCNLSGGLKPVPDALVRLGWIPDDSPRYIAEFRTRQKQVTKKRQKRGGLAPGVLIQLFPMEGECKIDCKID